MNKITTVTELRSAILLIEIKQLKEGLLLKEQFKKTYESLKPVNLIKNTVNELIVAPDLKGDLLNAAMSLAAGFVSKKLMVGDSDSPLRKLIGTLLQMGVTSIVSKNADKIKSVGENLIDTVLGKKESI
ncbi:MAG: hypothetical protein V4608_13215 [Bacteroidota bacterium]